MTSMGPIIQIREHGKILTMLLNILQGLAANVVCAGLLREECLRIKAQVIADGQNPPGPLRLHPTPTPCKKLRRSIECKFIERMLLIISPERL